jgi:hypothetical protein
MFVSLQWALCAHAESIVVPGAYATTEGDIALNRANLPPARFQQLYEAAEFATLGGPVLITGYAARPHATLQSGPAAVSGGNMDIWMSTTNRTVSTLSTTFAENHGADHTLVGSYDSTDVFTTANLPGPGNTKQFDVVQMFETPFRYDPTAGNLILEFRTDGSTLISGSEFFTSACLTGSSCPMREVISIGAPDATSGMFQNAGEINLFLYEPVPEVVGDYNNDGSVDAADYVAWQKSDGTQSGYNTWRSHFGQTIGSGSDAVANSSVPEPATIVMVIMATLVAHFRR